MYKANLYFNVDLWPIHELFPELSLAFSVLPAKFSMNLLSLLFLLLVVLHLITPAVFGEKCIF
jgi:hypothetical protein